MEARKSPECVHTDDSLTESWRSEMLRREQTMASLREEYQEVLQPILVYTEAAPRVWSSEEDFNNYLYNVGIATSEVMLQVVPGPDQEGINNQELFSLFTEVAGAPHSACQEAFTDLLSREKIRTKDGKLINRTSEQ